MSDERRTAHFGGGFNAGRIVPTTPKSAAEDQPREPIAPPRTGRDGRPLILTSLADSFEEQYRASRLIDAQLAGLDNPSRDEVADAQNESVESFIAAHPGLTETDKAFLRRTQS